MDMLPKLIATGNRDQLWAHALKLYRDTAPKVPREGCGGTLHGRRTGYSMRCRTAIADDYVDNDRPLAYLLKEQPWLPSL